MPLAALVAAMKANAAAAAAAAAAADADNGDAGGQQAKRLSDSPGFQRKVCRPPSS